MTVARGFFKCSLVGLFLFLAPSSHATLDCEREALLQGEPITEPTVMPKAESVERPFFLPLELKLNFNSEAAIPLEIPQRQLIIAIGHLFDTLESQKDLYAEIAHTLVVPLEKYERPTDDQIIAYNNRVAELGIKIAPDNFQTDAAILHYKLIDAELGGLSDEEILLLSQLSADFQVNQEPADISRVENSVKAIILRESNNGTVSFGRVHGSTDEATHLLRHPRIGNVLKTINNSADYFFFLNNLKSSSLLMGGKEKKTASERVRAALQSTAKAHHHELMTCFLFGNILTHFFNLADPMIGTSAKDPFSEKTMRQRMVHYEERVNDWVVDTRYIVRLFEEWATPRLDLESGYDAVVEAFDNYVFGTPIPLEPMAIRGGLIERAKVGLLPVKTWISQNKAMATAIRQAQELASLPKTGWSFSYPTRNISEPVRKQKIKTRPKNSSAEIPVPKMEPEVGASESLPKLALWDRIQDDRGETQEPLPIGALSADQIYEFQFRRQKQAGVQKIRFSEAALEVMREIPDDASKLVTALMWGFTGRQARSSSGIKSMFLRKTKSLGRLYEARPGDSSYRLILSRNREDGIWVVHEMAPKSHFNEALWRY